MDGLMAWRSMIMDLGMVSHGVVNCPVEAAAEVNAGSGAVEAVEGWASWHVLTAVVQVPRFSPELDPGELLARLVGARLDPESAYVESFTTEIGCGTGLILQPAFPSAAEAAGAVASTLADAGLALEASGPLRYGLAAALAYAAGGGPGLLVTGTCMDPAQVLELAGLVALIAGRSRFGPAHDADSEAR